MNRLVAIGLGYSAKAVAGRLAAQGWHITGTSRDGEGRAAIRALGYEAVPFDAGATAVPAALAGVLGEATHLLISAAPARGDAAGATAPGGGGDPVLGLPGFGAAMLPNLRWIGYLSTIGVYGDHGGAWVDEDTPVNRDGGRALSRVVAEDGWRALGAALDVPVAVMRLSGIYGPGRNVLARLKAGVERRVYKPDQVFNRIHVDDIAAAVEASIARGLGGVYNITDDEPAPPQDVSAYGAALLGIEPPPLVDWRTADLTPMGRAFYLENKRVRNDRMKRELGVPPRYPTYREGLRGLLAAMV